MKTKSVKTENRIFKICISLKINNLAWVNPECCCKHNAYTNWRDWAVAGDPLLSPRLRVSEPARQGKRSLNWWETKEQDASAGRLAAQMAREAAADHLLERYDVVTVPGTVFGHAAEGYLRLTWAAPPNALIEGLRRIAEFCAQAPR